GGWVWGCSGPGGGARRGGGVAGDTTVWRRGNGLIGAGTGDGRERWQADRSAMILHEAPLLLATPRGPVLP
ncbi:MAG: hypothetical protein JJT89_15180, partial [Nitriliruptoraceae bacterium]|nr:hypothetical protein [Nitriliruptoraceae bacterium]